MTSFKDISIKDYTYHLPENRIAAYPLDKRDESSLLIARQDNLQKDVFKNIDQYLPKGSIMVINNTRVVQARLLFQKPTGAAIEIFCLEPLEENTRDIHRAFQQTAQATWFCFTGNAKKWKEGSLTIRGENGYKLTATKKGTKKDGYIIKFEWEPKHITFAEILECFGKTPLPPYIHRKAEDADKIRYQTVFAKQEGSVAAPTAGLHFTPEVLQKIKDKNIELHYLTLHVGAGTFKPVSAPTMDQHVMHAEQMVIDKQHLSNLYHSADKPIVCVGTTSLRSLESIYWLGVKLQKGYTPLESFFRIEQWEPYEDKNNESLSWNDALKYIIDFMDHKQLTHLRGETSLIILPGYKIHTAHLLVTNFHQPQSTLLLLVAAFYGDNWKKIYNFALENEFRFLSYGDSCLLHRNNSDNILPIP
ncbi:MAG: S-adenosylmethionine:tRNA ribosyltransferase-isomerase [Bacteroidota bacterium]